MEERELEMRLRRLHAVREPRPQAMARILQEVRRRERTQMLWRWSALAASVILVCGLGWNFWSQRQQPREQEARLAAQQLEAALRISQRKMTQLEARLVVHVNSGVDLGIQDKVREN